LPITTSFERALIACLPRATRAFREQKKTPAGPDTL
jgi:hypothetical protein